MPCWPALTAPAMNPCTSSTRTFSRCSWLSGTRGFARGASAARIRVAGGLSLSVRSHGPPVPVGRQRQSTHQRGFSIMRTSFFTLLAAVILTGATASAHAQAREQGRLLTAAEVLDELRGARDQAIPDRLLERAYAIAVVPDVTKVSWFLGGRRGHGVLVVRDK